MRTAKDPLGELLPQQQLESVFLNGVVSIPSVRPEAASKPLGIQINDTLDWSHLYTDITSGFNSEASGW